MHPKITILEIAKIYEVTRQAIHKKLKEKGISSEKRGGIAFLRHDAARKFFDFDFTLKIVSMHLVKGGVGKTTLTQSIAVCASLYGARVLMIDIDPQGNLTDSFDIDSYKYPVMIDMIKENIPIESSIVNVLPGVDLVPSRIENITLDPTLMIEKHRLENVFSKRIDQVKKNYDLILIDCPPALNLPVTAAILASDLIIMPIMPAKHAVKALKILIKEHENIKENYNKETELKILLNNFDSRKTKSHKTLSDLMGNDKYIPLMFGSFIRTSQKYENILGDEEGEQKTIFDLTKWTIEKEDIGLITRELLNLEYIKKNA